MKRIGAYLGLWNLVWIKSFYGRIILRIVRKYPFGGYGCYGDTPHAWIILKPDGTVESDYFKYWTPYKSNRTSLNLEKGELIYG